MLSFLTNLWENNLTLLLLILILIIVIPFLIFYLTKAKEHPKGLVAAALSNMGERFGYYIMNAVLLLFLVSKFGLSDGTAGLIYAIFYFGIYILSLVGGLIADRTQNYNRTIQIGLFIMAAGYVALSIPLFSKTAEGLIANGTGGWWGILIFTCIALLCIAFGNGLFKGNLQALVGKLYDEFEAEAAKKGPEALKIAKDKRDSGFQIFYVFINIGGVIAPFVAPMLRKWWLNVHNFVYNADMSALCHQYINGNTDIATSEKFVETAANSVLDPAVLSNTTQFCSDYVNVFNTGVHFSFIVSAVAMIASLCIFLANKHRFPQPAKKVAAQSVEYTEEEKLAMAKEIKQRMAALFAVLGIAVFFWLSFHQNGQSLSVFARDFVETKALPAEIWQAMNPLFVIILTPIIMVLFGSLARKGKPVSTPRKIALGMGIAGMAYLFLMIFSIVNHYPSGDEFRELTNAQMVQMGLSKAAPWVMIVTYFFLTVAELFISPLGLSFVSKVAPRNMVGLCQGLWLGATAIGNLFIFVGPIMLNAWPIWKCWGVFLLICLVSMCVMLGMVKWLEKVTKD
ncbi:MAG: peptide MFS transporter [Bacteroidales bacterium]|nr:peptide MFS transporter [Bacteroidales bacterium]MBQ1708709.1 peptide MFS transporter [Bacteroidales bacterium]MBQ2599127.1 peptide MFS transporter [Bacteroidales bacterium]MBQ4013028.1 peptide MFS transporter [Bacteroidales bacterium]